MKITKKNVLFFFSVPVNLLLCHRLVEYSYFTYMYFLLFPQIVLLWKRVFFPLHCIAVNPEITL